jgi:phytanoyl-CoA hydroxylase
LAQLGQHGALLLRRGSLRRKGQLRQAKALSINKIGHAMHDLDPVFEAFYARCETGGGGARPRAGQPQVWQSMYIFKQPGIGGEVRWHQDATFSTPTRSA